MPSLDWQVVAEIATTVSMVAFAASAIVVVLQLRQAAPERYFSVTAHLFEIWQSPELQRDQLFLLHKLSSATWEDFCSLGRGEDAERAIHRVGGYYDRVGNLVSHSLIQKEDTLPRRSEAMQSQYGIAWSLWSKNCGFERMPCRSKITKRAAARVSRMLCSGHPE